ncbi:hypothetical protein [Devosia sp.]|uniref:hypothetical protein n=1 Tax=Devosia sp. TaxID=1871048 RepID=UPI001A014EE1|nr:hypothetical protein [Devosia sp.]MBE0580278.1 hypothetical protein [Devosia sp.]
MSLADTIVSTADFSLRTESNGPLAVRPRTSFTLTPGELSWQIGDGTRELRRLDEIRSLTLGQFGLPRGGTAWRCRIEFDSGAPLSVICLSGDIGTEETYQQFVRLVHAHLLAIPRSAEIVFTAARARKSTKFFTFGILPLVGLGCLASAFLSGQFVLFLLAPAIWVVALVQANELRVNDGQRYDPTELPQVLLP